MDEDGKIYARGAQDMKCVGMQFLAAIRFFIRNNIRLKRTIHLTYVPEEEIGGFDGMKEFIHTEEFKKLNAGCSLDEGIASETDVFKVYYAERAIWRKNYFILVIEHFYKIIKKKH
jgi:aminoacylase